MHCDKYKAEDFSVSSCSAVLAAGGLAMDLTPQREGRGAKCHQCPQLPAGHWERMRRGPCLSNQLDCACGLINKCIGYCICLFLLTSGLEAAASIDVDRCGRVPYHIYYTGNKKKKIIFLLQTLGHVWSACVCICCVCELWTLNLDSGMGTGS